MARRSSRRGALDGRLAVAWLALAFAACGGTTERAIVAVGAPAPSYEAVRLDGSAVHLADLKGQVVLLNIWATWCKPCRQEMPALDTLFRRHEAEGFTVVGVSIDSPGEQDRVAEYAKDLGASYTLWHDPDNAVSTTFLAIGVPASYLIGRDGTLRWRHVGPVTAEDGPLNAALRTALAEAAAAPSPGTP
jgi:cytochrome c biogenesis protein CcmG/thiol:disulfide interchange protein DsbE